MCIVSHFQHHRKMKIEKWMVTKAPPCRESRMHHQLLVGLFKRKERAVCSSALILLTTIYCKQTQTNCSVILYNYPQHLHLTTIFFLFFSQKELILSTLSSPQPSIPRHRSRNCILFLPLLVVSNSVHKIMYFDN